MQEAFASEDFKWQPISDLPGDVASLENAELRALAEVWREQRASLDARLLRDFNERLQREWAIETGIIERLYTLDRGVTELLIEHGIEESLISSSDTDGDPHLVARMIQDHEAAIQWLFDFVAGNRELTTSYVKELHALMTKHQETASAVDTLGRHVEVQLLHGEYKALPNNPVRPNGAVHEYCPPEHVAAEMDRLIELHNEHEQRGVVPEVSAAWLHHRFSQVHPFQDGNGRVARALASLVFIRHSWFPTVVTRDDRETYLGALESADQDDLSHLIDFFAGLQRRSFVKALRIAGDVVKRDSIDQVIGATKELLEKRREQLKQQWQHALQTASHLQGMAENRLLEIAYKLESEIKPLIPEAEFFVSSDPAGGIRGHYFRRQIVETAKALDYFANPGMFHSWLRLVMRTDTQAEILLSVHGIGHEYHGVLGASLSFYRREQTETGEREVSAVTPLSRELFQINYLEEEDEAQARFEPWFSEGVLKGLQMWREGL